MAEVRSSQRIRRAPRRYSDSENDVPKNSSVQPTTPPSDSSVPPPSLDQASKTDADHSELEAMVRNLYLNSQFTAAFSGIRNMQKEIFLQNKVHVPLDVVARALRSVPSYLMHLTNKQKKAPTAHYDVFTIGELVQVKQHISHDRILPSCRGAHILCAKTRPICAQQQRGPS